MINLKNNAQKQMVFSNNVNLVVEKKDRRRTSNFKLNINEIKRKLPADTITKIRYFLRKCILLLFIGKKNFDLYLNSINDKNLDNSQEYRPLDFGNDEIIQIDRPDNHNADDIPSWWIDIMVGSSTIHKPYLFEAKDVDLVGVHATGFSANGSIIRETTIPRAIPLERAVNVRTVITKKLSAQEKNIPTLEAIFSLVNVHSSNYFHWITDGLSRLELVEYYERETGIKPKLLIPANPSSWQKQSLKLVGYDPEDCLCWDRSFMKVEKLIVPSFRIDPLGTTNLYNLSSSACHWLRDRVISNLQSDRNLEHSFSPRVLLSRGKTMRRRVLNEDELIKTLAPFGFVSYTLEAMSLADQIRLFRQAEIVIAPNGAGLTNIIFSQNPNLTVIEIMKEPFDAMYFYLSKLLGLKYYLFNCASTSQHTKLGDVVVDTNKLQDFVDNILIK